MDGQTDTHTDGRTDRHTHILTRCLPPSRLQKNDDVQTPLEFTADYTVWTRPRLEHT